jgi:uncharacterized protein (TIGR00251 family)
MTAISRLSIRVLPNAHKDEVVGQDEKGCWKIKLAAPALEGKANQALIRFLSAVSGVSVSRISIDRGERTRVKVIQIVGIELVDLEKLLAGGIQQKAKSTIVQK